MSDRGKTISTKITEQLRSIADGTTKEGSIIFHFVSELLKDVRSSELDFALCQAFEDAQITLFGQVHTRLN